MQPGDKVPNMRFQLSDGESRAFSDYVGKNLVLYFYPKDHTPGCTLEGQAFRDAYDQFKAANTEILGVSRDSVKTHQNFINKHGFPFALISDGDEAVCRAFDVIKEKNMYGRKVMGIVRSTFIFDDQGVLRKVFPKVKVKGHVDEVLAAVTEMAKG